MFFLARSLGDNEVGRLIVTIIEGADLQASDPHGKIRLHNQNKSYCSRRCFQNTFVPFFNQFSPISTTRAPLGTPLLLSEPYTLFFHVGFG